MIIENTQPDTGVFLDVQLRRNHALSERGYARLMVLTCLLSLAGGSVLWFIGAWPVIGFMGLDVVLIWLAFRHYRDRLFSDYERVILQQDCLLVLSVAGRKKRSQQFEPFFLKVLYRDEGDALQLASGGQVREIGRWLAPQERSWLAMRLREALRRRLAELPHVQNDA